MFRGSGEAAYGGSFLGGSDVRLALVNPTIHTNNNCGSVQIYESASPFRAIQDAVHGAAYDGRQLGSDRSSIAKSLYEYWEMGSGRSGRSKLSKAR